MSVALLSKLRLTKNDVNKELLQTGGAQPAVYVLPLQEDGDRG